LERGVTRRLCFLQRFFAWFCILAALSLVMLMVQSPESFYKLHKAGQVQYNIARSAYADKRGVRIPVEVQRPLKPLCEAMQIRPVEIFKWCPNSNKVVYDYTITPTCRVTIWPCHSIPILVLSEVFLSNNPLIYRWWLQCLCLSQMHNEIQYRK
jgi:hypothetical protein